MKIARHFNAGINSQKLESRRDDRKIQPSLRDLNRFRFLPGIEMPGYFRLFLRNNQSFFNSAPAS